MKNSLLTSILVMVFLLLIINHPVEGQNNDRLIHKLNEKINSWKSPLPQWNHIAKPKLDSLLISMVPDKITLYFSPGLSYYPFREESCLLFIQSIKKSLGRRYRKYQIEVVTN